MSEPVTAAAPSAPKPRKTRWDTIITTTPVVMTIVATILAGLSSGEMGRAQYYRAIAAQTQSKVSDQWNFFQAKRLRASGVDNALKLPLLMQTAAGSRFDAKALKGEIARLVGRLAKAEMEADRANTALANDHAADAPARAKAVSEARDALVKVHHDAASLQQELDKALADEAVGNGLTLVAAGELPKVEDKPIANSEIREALKAVESSALEPESAAVLNKIKDEDLAAAMKVSDDNSAAFDAAAKPLGKAVERAQQMLAKFGSITTAAERAADEFEFALDAMTGTSQDLTNRAANIARLARAAAAESARLNADLTAASLRYDSARYQRESNINLVTARLYEIQVRKVTLTAERHRTRSYYFFYGMLTAQAAVTLASLALAVKERSVFWSIAATLGASAVAYGGYVYLFK